MGEAGSAGTAWVVDLERHVLTRQAASSPGIDGNHDDGPSVPRSGRKEGQTDGDAITYHLYSFLCHQANHRTHFAVTPGIAVSGGFFLFGRPLAKRRQVAWEPVQPVKLS